MLHATIEMDVLIGGDEQIDIIYAIQTLEHVFLIHLNLLVISSDGVVGGVGTICRAFECHLGGYIRYGCTFIAIGELRFVFLLCIHLCYAELVEVCTCSDDEITGYWYLCSACAITDNRHSWLVNEVDLELDRLVILKAHIEFVRHHAIDHAAWYGVVHCFSSCECESALGGTA